MKQILIIITTITTTTVASSCNSKKDSQPTKKETYKKTAIAHENENTVTLTTEQAKFIGIELGSIEQKNLTHSIKANGILTVPNQNKAFIAPLLSGVVKSLHVQPGAFIKQGQVVATLVNPNLIQMQQQLQQANAQIALSETEAKRQQALVQGNAAPLKRLQQIETELETLKSQRSSLQKQLSAVGATQNFSSSIAVKAPISGTISKIYAQLGSNVSASTPIAEMVNNNKLYLTLYVYEKDLPKLKPSQAVHFTITNNVEKAYNAEIFSIGTAFEAESKTIPVYAKIISDKTGLINGMNATALISLNKLTVPAVPTDAIVNHQGKDYIFIATSAYAKDEYIMADTAKAALIKHKEENKNEPKEVVFKKIPIAKGVTDVGYSEITLLKSIPANAKVVTKGAFFILAKITHSQAQEH